MPLQKVALRRYKLLGLVVALGLPTLSWGQGQEGVGQPAPEIDTTLQIESVQVRGIRARHVIAPQLLQGSQLEKLSLHSVADALRFFSGVQLKDYGGVGGLKSIDIRSMGTNHVGVYYDGIQVGNALNGQVDLGRLSLDNVESISVYTGQKSEIFQSARDFATAGSLYIETRPPRFEEGTSTNVRGVVKSGSFGLINLSGLLEHRVSPHLSVSMNAEWLHANGKYKFRYIARKNDGSIAYDTTAVRQNGDVNAIRAEAGLYGIIPGGSWRVRLYHYNSERGMPGAIVANVWRRGEREWDRNSFVQAQLRVGTLKWHRMQVGMKYMHDFIRYQNLDPKMVPVHQSYRQQEAYGSLSNLFTITDWLGASLAYDFQWNDLLSRDEPGDRVVNNFPFPRRYMHQVAGAVSFDKWGFKLQGSILATYVRDRVRDDLEQPKLLSAYTPGCFASYTPYEPLGLTIRAFYKHSFRMPTFNDLYYDLIGSISHLNPERVVQYDAGIAWYKEWEGATVPLASLSVDGYFNEVTDKIVAIPRGSQFRWSMFNLGRVRIWGIDALAELHFVLPVGVRSYIKGQYTWQLAHDYSDPKSKYYMHQIAYIPEHSGSAIFGVEWKGFVGFNYSFIYAGERYSMKENIPENYVLPWYTHDLSIWGGYRFGEKGPRVRLAFDVNNLLGQDYEVVVNYPMPKTNFKVTLRVEV